MHINATFQVNRFNVLLLSIVRTTSLNTSFYIANIFLVGKAKEDYIQAIEVLQKLASTCSVIPKVIFINKEDALANAIAQVFLEARQFYCVFHINQCVLARVQKEYLEEKDQELFMNDQKKVIQAKIVEEFNEKQKLLMKGLQ